MGHELRGIGAERSFIPNADIRLCFICEICFRLWSWCRKILAPRTLKTALTQDFETKLHPNMRLNDWGHLFGNLSQTAVHQIPNWPEVLNACRSLCRFWRSGTWRAHVIDKLSSEVPDIPKRLKRFQARFNQIRYQTIHDCFSELDRLREIHTEHDIAAFFTEFQDQALLRDARKASQWLDLWKIIRAFHRELLTNLEHCRRWGLARGCPRRKKCGIGASACDAFGTRGDYTR